MLIAPMQRQFKTIGLIGKPDAERISATLEHIHQHLTAQGFRVLLDRGCAGFVSGNSTVCDIDEIGRSCDAAVIVGGDGTLLRAARLLVDHEIPLIGVNLGRLGFLVDISPDEVRTRLDAILGGDYQFEERALLRVRVSRNGTVVHDRVAVNEIVVHSAIATSMIEIETWIDGAFLNTQRSDGLIISTPTGSTAYALSAGGPILHPGLNALVLAPINPHTLTNRPIVIGGDSLIEIGFRPSKQFRAQVNCDNVSIPDVEATDRLRITRHDRPFRMLHPVDHDFFAILRSKLNWSSGNRN
ncbi:NAD(+) kinase [Methylolobus aquaticus]